MTREQFNRRLPATLSRKIAVEAAEANLSLDTMTELVFGEWFGGWTKKERELFYEKAKRKVRGAPSKCQCGGCR